MANERIVNSCASKTRHCWTQCQDKTTKMHFANIQMGNLSGEEFMVLEKLVGEKFIIPCKNIHPWVLVQIDRLICQTGLDTEEIGWVVVAPCGMAKPKPTVA